MKGPLAIALVIALAAPAVARTQGPPVLEEVRVDENVGAQVPPELLFSSAEGRRIRLGTLFDGRRPVLLILTYVRCKTLCSLVLRGAMDAVRALPLELGRDYRVVMVSIDPTEDLASAAARRRDILRTLGRDDADWSYLIGAEHPIRALADTLGFRYAVDARTDQFAHPAVIFVLTPDGKIARYLHGVGFAPAELAAALRSAARGEVMNLSLPETVLSCFRFDPAARAHRDTIERYLKIGSAGVMLVLGSSIGLLFLWERRRRRRP